MNTISYTNVRSNLSSTMEKVCNDHSPVIITRKNAESVIMMSLDDYNSLIETAYLLRSPKNAARLTQSLQELEKGELLEMKKEDNSDNL